MSKLNRRQWLRNSALAGIVVWTPTASRARGQTDSPNEKLDIAMIGSGGRATANLAGVGGENIVALCDVDQRRAARTFQRYPKVPKFADYRVMLDEMDGHIDALWLGLGGGEEDGGVGRAAGDDGGGRLVADADPAAGLEPDDSAGLNGEGGAVGDGDVVDDGVRAGGGGPSDVGGDGASDIRLSGGGGREGECGESDAQFCSSTRVLRTRRGFEVCTDRDADMPGWMWAKQESDTQ